MCTSEPPSVPQMGKVYNTMTEKGVTGEILQHNLLGLGRISDLSEAAVLGIIPPRVELRKFLGLNPFLPESIVLTVDYSTGLEAMIAAGRYDRTGNRIIAEQFPISGTGIVKFEAELVYPNCFISSDDVEARIGALDATNPWVSGNIEHVLAFGELFPEEQRKYPIVGLGSVAMVDGRRRMPCLGGNGSERYLGFSWGDSVWNADCRFLAVRKVSVPSGS